MIRLPLLAICIAIVLAERGFADTIYVTGAISTDFPLANDCAKGICARLRVDGGATSVACGIDSANARQFSCVAVTPARPRAVRLEIQSPWHKPYSKNFSRIKRRGNIRLAFGAIQLTRLPLPDVLAVIVENDDTPRDIYAVTIRNPLANSIHLERLEIETVLEGTKGCLVAVPALYAVLDEVELTAAAASKAQGRGQFEVVGTDATNRIVGLTGTVTMLECRKRATMHLTLPVSISIPAKDTVQLRIAVPRTLKMRPQTGSPPWVNRREIPVNGFEEIRFRFHESTGASPDVVARYNMPRGRMVKIY
jgi:hypothetical protein